MKNYNDEIKDAKIEEKKNSKVKSKKNIGIYIVICMFVFIIMGALVVALNNVGLLNIDPIMEKVQSNGGSKKKVTLNYTDTSSLAKDGIYITDVSNVVEEVMPSIVSITSKTLVSSGSYGPSFFGQQQYSTGAGSGIIISQTDDEILILTNNHVVEDASELSVQFINEKTADATIKGTSAERDVAVISIDIGNLDDDTKNAIKIATIGDSDKLKVGNGIIAIGNALGYGQSVTVGVVSALNREVTIDNITNKMIQIDAAINGGNSGGALLNNSGEVVGINSAKYSSSVYSSSASIEGMGFAIPISDVKDLIEDLMNNETPSSNSTASSGSSNAVASSNVTLGVRGSIVSSANFYGMPAGFYISEIVSGSGAEKAGLEAGDVIVKIEGKSVSSLSDIRAVLAKKNAGDTVSLTIAYQSGNTYKEKDVSVVVS